MLVGGLVGGLVGESVFLVNTIAQKVFTPDVGYFTHMLFMT